jgi:hypothetical protein
MRDLARNEPSTMRQQPMKLPIWLRTAVVIGLTLIITSASLFAYRWYVHPAKLSIAVGFFGWRTPESSGSSSEPKQMPQ